ARRDDRPDHVGVHATAFRVMINRGGPSALLRWRLRRAPLFASALAVFLVVGAAAQRSDGPSDGPSFTDIDEHFKYVSVGTEERVGPPYWIWRVLPQIFEDKLPKRPGSGYERLGFMSEPGRPAQSRPMGT